MVGRTISHYKVLSEVGRGGMGVVYKAEDLKLKRTVALKFLAPHLLQDEEARKRFQREATAAAGLSHPNICTIHEISEEGGQTFLVMEFIEGEGLDNKIERGPLALKEALGFARQVADGLAAAHAKGVVHRDIKPGNLLVTPEGRVKIIDFGLALLTEGSKLTKLDGTVGTVAYMSPEQAQGIEVDYRTDIWALGCVTYEMVRGQRPFQGVYDQALVYEIVNQEPEPLTGVRKGVPMELEWIVGKCLAKDREDRYNHAEDMMLDLRTLAEKLKSGGSRVLRTQPAAAPSQAGTHSAPFHGSAAVGAQPGLASQQTAAPVVAYGETVPKRKLRVHQALLAVTALALLAVSFVHFRETPPEKQVRKFALTPEDFQSSEARAAISPHAEYIVYSAGTPRTSLWVQPLNQESLRRLEGTEGATRPFWSSDSEFIGFVVGRNLKRVPVSGGPTVDICSLPGTGRFFLAAWRPDGESIVFASQNPIRLFEVSARGGELRVLVDRAVEGTDVSASSPQFLLDRILLYRVGSDPSRGETLVARDMETGAEQEWPLSAGFFVYSRTGHILYQLHFLFTGELWALPFSSDPLGPSGDSFPIANNASWPSVADAGVLVYRQDGVPQSMRVRIVGRSGTEIDDTDRRWRIAMQPTFSLDGRRLIGVLGNDDTQDIWLYNLINRNWTRLTADLGREIFPVWAPDEERVAFASNRGRDFGIYVQSAEPSEAQLLLDTPGLEVTTDWNRAADRILYYRVESDERGRDLWYLEPDGRGGYAPKLFLSEPFNQRSGAFSPDGRWVAYVTDQEGPNEVYVRKFPEGTPVHKVSRQGGEAPRWRGNGQQLYYVEGQTLVAVDVNLDDEFSFGAPQPLFSDPVLLDDPIFRRYDVAPDGQTFAVASLSPEALASSPVIRVVENWFEEFRDREQD